MKAFPAPRHWGSKYWTNHSGAVYDRKQDWFFKVAVQLDGDKTNPESDGN